MLIDYDTSSTLYDVYKREYFHAIFDTERIIVVALICTMIDEELRYVLFFKNFQTLLYLHGHNHLYLLIIILRYC